MLAAASAATHVSARAASQTQRFRRRSSRSARSRLSSPVPAGEVSRSTRDRLQEVSRIFCFAVWSRTRYDLKLWITHLLEGAAYLPR